MAEGGGDLLTCAICLESYKRPKFLPCYHSFCSYCLEGYINKNSCDRQFKCPLCRETCSVPINGVQGFIKNFYITAVDKMALRESVPCDFCDGKAEKKCFDCDQVFCQDCLINFHMKLRKTKNHVMINISRPEVHHYCLKHPNEFLTCKKCGEGTVSTGSSLWKVEHVRDIKLPSEKDVRSIAPVGEKGLWVSLDNAPEIHLINHEGKLLQSVPIVGNTYYAAADMIDNAIVSSYHGKCLVQVTPAGITEIILSQINDPRGIACRKNEDGGQEIFFSNFSSPCGVLVMKSDKSGPSNILPLSGGSQCVAADPNSDVLCVSASLKKEIIFFQRNGTILARYKKGFQEMKSFGLCFDSQGCIIIADYSNKQVFRVNQNAAFIQILVDGLSEKPFSVNIDEYNQLWVGLTGGNIKMYKLH